jgi:hypothetical protein
MGAADHRAQPNGAFAELLSNLPGCQEWVARNVKAASDDIA